MKNFLWGLVLVLLATFLSGCSGDPVKEDLEAYLKVDKIVGAKYNPTIMRQFEDRISNAETDEEVIPILEEVVEAITDARNQFATLKPKSEEMKIFVGGMVEGMDEVIAAHNELIQVYRSGDSDQFDSAEVEADAKIERTIQKMQNIEKSISQLAKEKRVTI